MTEQTQHDSEVKSGVRNGLILALFALISTGLTAFTWLLTRDKIQTEKELALLRAISEIVPPDHYANDPYRDCVLLTDETLLGTDEPRPAWRLRDKAGENIAVLITSNASNGYNGKIEIIVGHFATAHKGHSNKLAGVRVTSHQETPGLGDKVEVKKSNWILQFSDLDKNSLESKDWKVKKDGGKFDAFTGATITPRAVLAAIEKNNQYFEQHEQQLFAEPANCPVDAREDKTND